MAETSGKDLRRVEPLDQLPVVQEHNRAFLGLLQARLNAQRPCFGLPAAGRIAVRSASSELLDGVAAFPRALFRLALPFVQAPQRPESEGHPDDAEHDLVLSMLIAARTTSRQSPYQARLLLELSALEVEQFRALSLADVQGLAALPDVLQCAFRQRPWFWPGIFGATRPELRRQLTLMALQPRLAVDWPRRRAPHASS